MKKALVLVLAACMMLAMAACSTPTPAPTTAPTVAPSAAAAATEASAATSAPAAPAPASVKTLSVFINMTWYPTKTFTGIIPDEITKETGVKLDPTIAVDDKQLGVMIASGSLPDMVYSDSLNDRLSNADICFDYDSLISKYNVDWKITDAQRAIAQTFSSDGKIYCVKNHASTTADWQNATYGVPMDPSMFIRQDLYTQLGSPKLDTLDDFTAILGQVKAKWPDITPFTFDYNWRFNVLRMWCGVGWIDFVKQDDGTYKFYTETAAYQNEMKMLNSWFQKGYMSADNFAATNTTATAPYEGGKAFSLSSCTQNNNANEQAALTKVNPSYITVEIKPLANFKYVGSDIGWAGTFVTKKCSDPETAIKFIAWEFTPDAQMLTQNGRKGTEYTVDANGLPTFSKEWMDAVADGSQITKYDPWFYFGGSAIAESFGRCASLQDYNTLYKPTYDAIRGLFESDPWIAASLPKSGTDERDIYDTLGSGSSTGMIANYEAKMIMSATDADFTKNYNDFMAALKSAGIDKLDAYMSQAIPPNVTKFGG